VSVGADLLAESSPRRKDVLATIQVGGGRRWWWWWMTGDWK
jgi:hypothetical protein